MAVVNRWYRILELLVTQQRLTLEEMRSDLNVSLSTLQKSIEQLNELLDSDLQIKQEGQLVSLEVYDYRRLEDILAGSLRKESDFNSSSKRTSYLIKRLVRSSQPLLIDDLAEEIGVSRTTINKDLRQVKELAEAYQVNILGRPNRGLEVSGSELNLRLFYIHHVYAYFDSDSLTEESQSFLEDLYQTFKLPKKTQELLTKVIAITIARLRRQQQLQQPLAYFINELADSDLVHQLIYHIEMTYHLSLSQYEQDFISYPLHIQYIDGLPYRPSPSPELLALFQKMVQKVKETLLVTFNEESLYLEMHRHLKFLLHRLIFHVQANDIFHGDIPNKYPLAFEMAKVAGQELQQLFGYQLAISELSYLALYFEMALREEESENRLRTRKIAVVCTTGLGTANMICRQLRRVLGQEISISQYSEEEFNPLEDDDYFAIFTTIPLKLTGLKSPVVHLTNLFDDQWLQNEWKRVNRYHQKNLETITLKFIRLSEEASYQAYLEKMVASLEKEGLVDSQFLNRTLDRELQQSTIFGNGIGFPHTINQKEGQTILMLAVLDPIHQEGAEQVEFIFLVAIPQQVEGQMEAELLELYDDIFRVASDSSLKGGLKKVMTEAEFLAFTRSKGVF
ncbi:BglG family transcription antiterminator [Streptococcus ferus]|uniref:BglG family transcription antiterminator n=1 Tax=Streptococcus ferus TaxID=1345 RepID=UPI0035A0D30B